MPRDLDGLADIVVLTVKNAMAPVLERLALVEQENARLKTDMAGVGSLRDRIVTVETKAAMPTPAAIVPEAVDLTPLAERVAVVEAALARLEGHEPQIADVRERLVSVETKAAMPVAMPEPVDLTPLTGRIAVLESNAAALVPVVHSVGEWRDRLVAVETKTAASQPTTANTDTVKPAEVELLIRKSLDPVLSSVSEARERIVSLEARAPIPGPAGKDGIDGKDGKDGERGTDGLGFDDMDVEFDGDRTLSLKFARGKDVRRWPIVLPFQRYQGVFMDGKSYETGDVVTWAGSTWHANEPTSMKPGDGSKAWTLSVKKGRDGKDGAPVGAGGLPIVSVNR
jgi:hypothetical protein